jgi:hypothetical protein
MIWLALATWYIIGLAMFALLYKIDDPEYVVVGDLVKVGLFSMLGPLMLFSVISALVDRGVFNRVVWRKKEQSEAARSDPWT